MRRHFNEAARLDTERLRRELSHAHTFNARIATRVTHFVSSMTCAYTFAAIALISLPAAIATGQVIIIVAWIAQTFLQLVLLSIIMVGQDEQAQATEHRAQRTLADAEKILDRLDDRTAGGISTVIDEVRRLHVELRRQA